MSGPARLLLVLLGVALLGSSGLAATPSELTLPYVPGRVLVRFKSGAKVAAMSAAHGRSRATVAKTFRRLPGLQLVGLPSDLSVPQALRRYREDPNVLYAEPDYIFRVDATPNDPQFSQLWGLTNIAAPQAWDITTGSADVVVAVIDTGIDYTHEDLAGNMWRSSDCDGDGIDDDGSGYADDCHGIDALNADSDPRDDHRHGTHVAGTIGAVGDNGVGVVGVNWRVKLLACKFLSADGSGPGSAAIECLDYIAHLKSLGVNIVASNNSWGGPGVQVAVRASQSLQEAVDLNLEMGILFIIAAGNGGLDRIGDDKDPWAGAPSNIELPNVIAVAAIKQDNALTTFSNFGRHSVHLAAPGDGILSTVPRAIVPEGYASYRGTSMATPHVAGVAALLKAADPSLAWHQLRNLILAGGTDTAALSRTITRKRLNAHGSLRCSDSVLLARLTPRFDVVGTSPGTPVPITYLHIDCAAPNGEIVATVAPTGESVTLRDDGAGFDRFAGDGTYAGSYTPAAVGQYQLSFPGGDVLTLNVLRPYTFQQVSEPYRVISGASLNLPPATVAAVTPPFPLRFGGQPYDSILVSPHGTASFGVPWGDPNRFPVYTYWVSNLVAPFWSALAPYPDTAHNVFWEVRGSAPDRELVIEWRDLAMIEPPEPRLDQTVRFQAVFFEGRDDILFVYADTVFGGETGNFDHGTEASVGIQVAPNVGTQYSFLQRKIFDGDAILWRPAAGPVIIRLDPFYAVPHAPPLTVTVHGLSFEPASFVRRVLDGVSADMPVEYRSPSELALSMPADVLARSGTHRLFVVNPSPGGELVSNPADFEVMFPPPWIDSMDPVSRPAGSGPFTLNVRGRNLRQDAIILWNGFSRATTFISSTEVQALIRDYDVETPGHVQVGVWQNFWVNGFLDFVVTASAPELQAIQSTATVTAGGVAAYSLQYNGSSDVAFSCSNLPAGATCRFTPPSVAAGGAPAAVSLSVTTTARQSAALAPALWAGFALAPWPLALLLLRGQRTRRLRTFPRRELWPGLASLVVLLLLLAACGGGGGAAGARPRPAPSSGTPAGTYTFTVAASGPGGAAFTRLTLVVR